MCLNNQGLNDKSLCKQTIVDLQDGRDVVLIVKIKKILKNKSFKNGLWLSINML